jgi:hypothetical protein
MGIFSNIFAKKKITNVEVFKTYTDKVLDVAAIPKTQANKLKVSVYLLFAQLGIVHVVAAGKARPFLGALVEDVKESTKDLTMRISELALNDTELQIILNEFPAEANLTSNVTINGLAAFEAIYFAYLGDLVPEIGKQVREQVFLFATLKLLEATIGGEQAQIKLLPTSLVVTKMTGEVIKAFR